MSAEQRNGLSLGIPPELVDAIAELKRLSIIEKVGEHPSSTGRRPMNLFRPGPGRTSLLRAERRGRDRQLAGKSR